MKPILASLFLFLLINNEAPTACLSASQNRIFPIGLVKDTVVVFETRLRRSMNYENKEEHDWSPHWRGVTYLKKYTKKNKLIASQIIDSLQLFSEENYVEIIEASFNKSMNKAILECNLELLEPESVTFCDFQNKCSALSINVDTVKKELFIRLKNSKTRYPVSVLKDSTSIVSNIAKSNNYYEGYFDKEPSFLDISSIRKFKAGNMRLTIAHLGIGQSFERVNGTIDKGVEYKPKFEFSKLNKSVFIEPVLHHGYGFDFMIFE